MHFISIIIILYLHIFNSFLGNYFSNYCKLCSFRLFDSIVILNRFCNVRDVHLIIFVENAQYKY